MITVSFKIDAELSQEVSRCAGNTDSIMYQGLSYKIKSESNIFRYRKNGIDASITLYDNKEPFVVYSITGKFNPEKIPENTDYFWADKRLFCQVTDNDTAGQKYNCRTTDCTASFTIEKDDEGNVTTHAIVREHMADCNTKDVTIKKGISECR